MTLLDRTRKDKTKLRQPSPHTGMGDAYMEARYAAEQSSAARIAAEIQEHHAHRPCPVCATVMVDGRCPEHGMPAEDRGQWLFGDRA